jgi:hypothetical protein
MPLPAYKKYLVRFTLPDGEHLGVIDSIEVKNERDAQFVTNAATLSLGQNPDAKLLDIEPLKSLEDLQRQVNELKARNPERPLASELGLDTPNRILTNPEIPRGLASMYGTAAPPPTGTSAAEILGEAAALGKAEGAPGQFGQDGTEQSVEVGGSFNQGIKPTTTQAGPGPGEV